MKKLNLVSHLLKKKVWISCLLISLISIIPLIISCHQPKKSNPKPTEPPKLNKEIKEQMIIENYSFSSLANHLIFDIKQNLKNQELNLFYDEGLMDILYTTTNIYYDKKEPINTNKIKKKVVETDVFKNKNGKNIKLEIFDAIDQKVFFVNAKLYKNKIIVNLKENNFLTKNKLKNHTFILKGIFDEQKLNLKLNFHFTIKRFPLFNYDKNKAFVNGKYNDDFINKFIDYLQQTKQGIFDFDFIKKSRNKPYFNVLINIILYQNLITPINTIPQQYKNFANQKLSIDDLHQSFWNAFEIFINFQNDPLTNQLKPKNFYNLQKEYEHRVGIDHFAFPFYYANSSISKDDYFKKAQRFVDNNWKNFLGLAYGHEYFTTATKITYNFDKIYTPFALKQRIFQLRNELKQDLLKLDKSTYANVLDQYYLKHYLENFLNQKIKNKAFLDWINNYSSNHSNKYSSLHKSIENKFIEIEKNMVPNTYYY
ncbi:hypothetical protein [Ureaplasma urealyticum]|nr:hypothetical protein [Ureaplasma urealyticum]